MDITKLKTIKQIIIKDQTSSNIQIEELIKNKPKNLELYYLVYFDYKGDYQKECKVALCEITNQSPDFELNKLSYIPFLLGDKSKDYGLEMPNNEFKAWRKIWDLEDVGIMEREYKLDFIEYNKNEKTIFIKAWKFSCA